jgi:pimeloyl-ACP methyl ester carboxylesterase
MEEYKHAYFETGGCRLHYVDAGSGPLVILYHGFPMFWFSFYPQIEALKSRFRVVAIDGLGVNLSSKPQNLELYKLENLARQIDELARHLQGDEPVRLVGHDWGGALAWAYAQQYPHRLHKVVAINAPPANQLIELLASNVEQQKRSHYMWAMREGDLHTSMTENGAARVWERAYAPFRGRPHYTKEHDEIMRIGLAQPGAIDGGINWYRANIPPLGSITDADFWPSRDAKTDVPALLIWGEKDQTFIPQFIDDLHRYATQLSVEILPGVGHTPMLEVPEITNKTLSDFLCA